jgi:hypothetical protein
VAWTHKQFACGELKLIFPQGFWSEARKRLQWVQIPSPAPFFFLCKKETRGKEKTHIRPKGESSKFKLFIVNLLTFSYKR